MKVSQSRLEEVVEAIRSGFVTNQDISSHLGCSLSAAACSTARLKSLGVVEIIAKRKKGHVLSLTGEKLALHPQSKEFDVKPKLNFQPLLEAWK